MKAIRTCNSKERCFLQRRVMIVSKLHDSMRLRREPAQAQGAQKPPEQFSWTY